MKTQNEKSKGLRISEVAELSGVAIPTIKFYIREGLIPRPVKRGKSTYYHDETSVERIRLIKRLQKERFYPLDVIKKLLANGEAAALRAEPNATETLGKEAYDSSTSLPVSIEDISTVLDYPMEKIKEIEEAGLVFPLETLSGTQYDPMDCQIISLVKQREETGIDFDYTLQTMAIYQKHLRRAVREDFQVSLKHMVSRVPDENIFTYLVEGEKSITTYLRLAKTLISRRQIEADIKAHDHVPHNIVEALNFRSLEEISKQTLDSSSTTGHPSASHSLLAHYVTILRSTRGLNSDLSISNRSRDVGFLIDGMLEIREGNYQKAQVCFSTVNPEGDYGSLGLALVGLTHILLMTQKFNLKRLIESIKRAMDCFEASQKINDDREIKTLATYFYLIAMAVYPYIFNPEQNLVPEYDRITDNIREMLADEPNDTPRYLFFRELLVKVKYFLAMAMIEIGDTKKVGGLLKSITSTSEMGYYSFWAKKKLEELG